MDLPNCFGGFFVGILLNSVVNMVDQRTFYLQVSVHPHEISSHTSITSAKNTNVFIVKLLRFLFEHGMSLVIYTRTKNIVYHLVGRNHLMNNGYFIHMMEK